MSHPPSSDAANQERRDSSNRPPSVDALARSLHDTNLPQPLLVDIAREAIAANDPQSARHRATALTRSMLQPVINATGVLLHTNLGRAPYEHQHDASYSNLEFDLGTGARGSRHNHAGSLVARACGAEAAVVVNNNAAAVLLALAALAAGKMVAVSRGEAVEIGGSFRVPEVLATSRATLVDVGTTNRTRVADYASASAQHGSDLAMYLKVHPSNYVVEGFTEEASVAELAHHAASIDPSPIVVVDIGSGLLDAACPWLPAGPPTWLRAEPAARQTLKAGADLIMFSGDKLLGGPQAGIIAGRADLVALCAKHPLARALRPGGMVLAALQATAMAYLRRDAHVTVPFWRMASVPVTVLQQRAAAMNVGTPQPMRAMPGAGTLPGVEIDSFGISISGDHTRALRMIQRPIIARCEHNTTMLDLRTIDPADDAYVAGTLTALLANKTHPQ